jgi:hypothetical protein
MRQRQIEQVFIETAGLLGVPAAIGAVMQSADTI